MFCGHGRKTYESKFSQLSQLSYLKQYACDICSEKLKSKSLFSIINLIGRIKFSRNETNKLILLFTQTMSNSFINCNQCNSKFYIKFDQNYIEIYNLKCSHGKLKKDKLCSICKKVQQRKRYQKCIKCKSELFFYNPYLRVVECQFCKIKYCDFCQKELQLFNKDQLCLCNINTLQNKLFYIKIQIFGIFIFIVTGIISGHWIEKSNWYQELKCNLYEIYNGGMCTKEQFIIDLKKFSIFMIGYIIYLGISSQIIQKISRFYKLNYRLSSLQSCRFFRRRFH